MNDKVSLNIAYPDRLDRFYDIIRKIEKEQSKFLIDANLECWMCSELLIVDSDVAKTQCGHEIHTYCLE